MTSTEAKFAIAESLANTAAGAQHDVFGGASHRLYTLPVRARAVIFDRVEDILESLAAAGFRVERTSGGD